MGALDFPKPRPLPPRKKKPLSPQAKRALAAAKGEPEPRPDNVILVTRSELRSLYKLRPVSTDRLVAEAQVMLRRGIREGDGALIRWYLDRVYGRVEQGPLRTILSGADFGNMDGVIAAGRQIMDGMATGAVPVAQAMSAVRTLHEYSKLRMLDELERLEGLLKAIEDKAKSGTLAPTEQVLPDAQLPAWGNLRRAVADVAEVSEPEEPGAAAAREPADPLDRAQALLIEEALGRTTDDDVDLSQLLER